MKEILSGIVVLSLGLGLTGCGSNTPEEVAEIFASSLSIADIKKAESVASEGVQEKLKKLGSICSEPAATKLADETIVVLNTIEEKSNDKKYSEQLKKISGQFGKNIDIFKKETEQDIISRYGSPKNVPEELREEEMNKALEKMVELADPVVEEEFKIFDIKTEHPDKVKRIIAEFMIKGGMGTRVNRGNLHVLKGIVKDVMSKNPEKITPQCIAQHTDFGLIDDINFIETKQDSPDSADVRLELKAEDGESKKVSIDVEKIKDEWKVSELRLADYF